MPGISEKFFKKQKTRTRIDLKGNALVLHFSGGVKDDLCRSVCHGLEILEIL
jgi:hypothetical protein